MRKMNRRIEIWQQEMKKKHEVFSKDIDSLKEQNKLLLNELNTIKDTKTDLSKMKDHSENVQQKTNEDIAVLKAKMFKADKHNRILQGKVDILTENIKHLRTAMLLNKSQSEVQRGKIKQECNSIKSDMHTIHETVKPHIKKLREDLDRLKTNVAGIYTDMVEHLASHTALK